MDAAVTYSMGLQHLIDMLTQANQLDVSLMVEGLSGLSGLVTMLEGQVGKRIAMGGSAAQQMAIPPCGAQYQGSINIV